MALRPQDHPDLLRLSAVPGVGSNRIRSLIGRFRAASRVFRASASELISVPGIDNKTAGAILGFDGRDFASEQLKKMAKVGAKLVTFWDSEYPDLLKQIYDPPAFLFVRGSLASSDRHKIAVVGCRQPSNYGRLITERMASRFARSGLTVVSGLAYGVDTIAHASAVQSGGRTIAVLGSALDVIYPAENVRLAEQIVEQGALISEFPFGTGPDRTNFPRRNRIITGLSLGVVVVEAGQKSGALITAAIALDQNREVFAVPGNVDSPKSIGTNSLIKQGAAVAISADDVIQEIAPQLGELGHEHIAPPAIADLSAEERVVLEMLSNEPLHIDLLAQKCEFTSSQALATLLTLELKNCARQLPGKLFVRA